MVKKRITSNNILFRTAIIIIITSFLFIVSVSGAHDQVISDRDIDINIENDKNALVPLDIKDPIIIKLQRGQPNSKNIDLITITNNFDSDMEVNAELTDNTDRGVNIKKNKKIIRPQQSESLYINVNSTQEPKNVEIKLEIDSNFQSTIYRKTAIEYDKSNNKGNRR